jgi:hypothetical protein
MSQAIFLRLLNRWKSACAILVALCVVFSATAFAQVTENNDRSDPSHEVVEHANVATRQSTPCSNDAHGVEQCCSALHCLVGIAVEPSTLLSAPTASLVGAEMANLGASPMPYRLDRPPKS